MSIAPSRAPPAAPRSRRPRSRPLATEGSSRLPDIRLLSPYEPQLCELLFAAHHLAVNQIIPVEDRRRCDECRINQTSPAGVDHTAECYTGRVLKLIAEILSLRIVAAK